MLSRNEGDRQVCRIEDREKEDAWSRAPIESNRFELYKSSIRLEGSNLYISSIRSELANCLTNTNIC
jgi:hypothetical protein